MDDRGDRYCVVGAGSSGLAAIRAFRQHGVPVECLEQEDGIGGNWYYGKPCSSTYRSTHMLTSRGVTEYPDFKMPDHYPHFPHHSLVYEYFQAYARHFDLYPHIEFNAPVANIEPESDAWRVTLQSGVTRRYRGVVIANGHHWDPFLPEVPGRFDGVALHSKAYKTPDLFTDKRVLVVGAGNSGADIALEATQSARQVFLSSRNGLHILPKFSFGQPGDETIALLARWRVPLWLQRLIVGFGAWAINGRPEEYGFPKARQKIFESHPTVNSQLLYRIGHGDITAKCGLSELCGDRVRFADGSVEDIDVIVYATGYRLSFPFIDPAHLNWKDGAPDLYLRVFHPLRHRICVVGMIQPNTSGQWGLAHYQSQLIARYLKALDAAPATAGWFLKAMQDTSRDLRHGHGNFATDRHRLEIEPYSYQRLIERLIRRFDRGRTGGPARDRPCEYQAVASQGPPSL